MKLRPIIFWTHLVTGVLAGLVILMMSATGVLLMYERQILELAERQYAVVPADGQVPITADELLDIGRRLAPDEHHFELKFVNRPGSPMTIVADNWYVWLVHPYTGEILREGDGAAANFFYLVTDIHRWFDIQGESRDIARAITAYSNLLFLVLIVTGSYLWLPRAWNWSYLKIRVFFDPGADNPKVRHFNWHHVFSVWSVAPLIVICLTATVVYFPWANLAVFAAFGEEAPSRDGDDEHASVATPIDGAMSQQVLLTVAKQHALANGAADWHSIWMEASVAPGAAAGFYIDRSIGHRPEYAYELKLDGVDGSVLRFMRVEDHSPGNQTRWFLRFLHTGEAYGFLGQTIAGLASLAACMLVYTGLSLAWRRLISPLLR